MLLSAHIPKTAGVSFRNILQGFYKEGFIQYYWKIVDADGRELPDVPVNATCVHGHFVASDLAAKFPHASVITWVRDPVERVVSSYYYRLREPDWKHPVCRQLHEQKLDLLSYASLPLVRNEIAHFIGKMEPDDFDFVGMAEHFDESLARFSQRFGLPSLPSRRDNCNPVRRQDFYELTPDIRSKILMLNEQDDEIYRKCVARFASERGQEKIRLTSSA
jgi:hypothetical protein